MPGAYAHLTLAARANSPEYLDAIADFPPEAFDALQTWSKFCALGAVSPDYPYMKLFNEDAARWADAMHYENTGALILAGVQKLGTLAGDERDKCFAWLSGYASHVLADVTIHPVVEAKVGPYEENKTAHRVCEMNQDVYIFDTLRLGDAGSCDFLKGTLLACGDGEGLDPAVEGFWRDLLAREHPALFRENRPEPIEWHEWFSSVVEGVSNWSALPDLIRRHSDDAGLTYPAKGEEEREYLVDLPLPDGKQGAIDYDALFARALSNVLAGWAHLARAVYGGDDARVASAREFFKPWNLDTGRESGTGERTFWA